MGFFPAQAETPKLGGESKLAICLKTIRQETGLDFTATRPVPNNDAVTVRAKDGQTCTVAPETFLRDIPQTPLCRAAQFMYQCARMDF